MSQELAADTKYNGKNGNGKNGNGKSTAIKKDDSFLSVVTGRKSGYLSGFGARPAEEVEE
jgi:hypothetical protein